MESLGFLRFTGKKNFFRYFAPSSSINSFQRQEALGSEMDFLLVIIVGAVVACALPIILVVTVVLRQRKSQRKYDAEKAEGNTDESKRLNEQSEEKVIKS